jgi:hypothetical protein
MSNSWLRQPSTITGLATAGGAILAAVAHYLTGNMELSGAVGISAFAVAHLAIDDNTADTAIETLVTDAVQDTIAGHLSANLPRLLNDAVAVANSVARKPAAAAATLLLGLGLSLSACAPGQTAAQAACAADEMLQPIAAQIAPMAGGAAGGVGGAATAAGLVALDAPVHAAVVAKCAPILSTGTAVNGVVQPPDPVSPAIVPPAAK